MALDANKLMKELSSGSKWDTGVTFNRTNPVPIDKSSYFIDINEAKNYALSGKTSYVGQQIFILDDELSTADVYVIQDLSGTLQKTVLSADLDAKFNSLSTYSNISNQLSNDGYATNAWVNENKSKVTIGNNESPANLSVYKVTAEEYAERIAEGDILSNELYVIDDDYINAFGMQLKNLHNGSDPTDAVTKQQLDQSNSYVLSVFSNAMLSAGISKTTPVDGISYGQALSCLYFIAQQIM